MIKTLARLKLKKSQNTRQICELQNFYGYIIKFNMLLRRVKDQMEEKKNLEREKKLPISFHALFKNFVREETQSSQNMELLCVTHFSNSVIELS